MKMIKMRENTWINVEDICLIQYDDLTNLTKIHLRTGPQTLFTTEEKPEDFIKKLEA